MLQFTARCPLPRCRRPPPCPPTFAACLPLLPPSPPLCLPPQVFTSCFIYPVRDSADSLRDFFYGVGHNRAQGATNMMLEAYHWSVLPLPLPLRYATLCVRWGEVGCNVAGDLALAQNKVQRAVVFVSACNL